MALPKQSEDFPNWYQSVVREAELAENGLARGSMVIKPWGYAIWEQIQRAVDDRIKATGHENVYFPTLIPEPLLQREADHVEGFAPEVIVATHAGGKEMEVPLVLTPSSETIIWESYSRWIQSYRDLPKLYNQWGNVFRAEMRSRLFLRTSEFLWQEGHTAHETKSDAVKEALTILRDVYIDTVANVLRLPVIAGRKSETERFPGADETFTFEAMMRDKKALQSGTSHYLGQNFAKAYDVQFQTRDGNREYAYATSWGVSTRLVGGLIMGHGDDQGLRLPSGVAPQQVVIVPIYRNDEERSAVVQKAQAIANELRISGLRVKVDDRDELRPGFKFNEWELKGVPARIEIGPRDLENESVLISTRLNLGGVSLQGIEIVETKGNIKYQCSFAHLVAGVTALIKANDEKLYDEAKDFQQEHIYQPNSYDDMREFLSSTNGFVLAPWDGSQVSEAKVKEDTKATIRCLPISSDQLDSSIEGGEIPTPEIEAGLKCVVTGNPATEMAIFAQAY